MSEDRFVDDNPTRVAKTPGETDDHRRRRPAPPELERFLSELVVGDPLHHDNLTLFPVFPSNDGGDGEPAPYDLLETAIAAGTLDVTEVDESGSVPDLAVVNEGPRPVLIPQGSLLVGAKQNRIVNVTVLVAASSTTRIPVSCVESGRWRRTTRTMSAAPFAHAGMRRKMSASIKERYLREGERRADQRLMWADVSELSHDLAFTSPSSDLTAGYAATEERRAAYAEALPIPEGALGVVAAMGGEIIGFDCFGRPDVFAQLWDRLSQGYFLEAVRDPEQRPVTEARAARAFVDAVASAVEVAEPEVGLGVSLDLVADLLAGGGLGFEGELCHLGAFVDGGCS